MRHMIRREWCPFCHKRLQPANSSIDHIHPQSAKGGLRVWYNEAGTCRKCNGKKANRTLLEFLMIRNQKNHPGPVQIPAVSVLPLDALGSLPMGWQDPLALLGYERPTGRGSNPMYVGLGAKQRKVLREKLAASHDS